MHFDVCNGCGTVGKLRAGKRLLWDVSSKFYNNMVVYKQTED
jgi:hypothetical protein